MKQHTVLIDLLRLGNMSGFGEIARNVEQRLAEANCNDLRFVFLTKLDKSGRFSDKVAYVTEENLDADLQALGYDIDLWHVTDQLTSFRHRRKGQLELLTVHDLNFLYEKHGIHRIKSLWRFRRKVVICICRAQQADDVLCARRAEGSYSPLFVYRRLLT